MPVVDKSSNTTEEPKGPFLHAFALLFEQIERMVALNITWALQILPLVAFFSFPRLPLWLRILFLLYTGCTLIPVTGMMFGMVARAQEGELMHFEQTLELLRALTARSLLVLAPLYSLFAWLAGFSVLSQYIHLLILDVLARLALLFTAVFAVYWGPLFAAAPQRSALAVLHDSIRLTWRHPGNSLLAFSVVLLTWVFGVFSIGGLVLVAPVLAALLQTEYYAVVARRSLAEKDY
jgi:hypothetical protein